MVEISNYINEHYDVVQAFNVEEPINAEIFCLCEVHTSFPHYLINAQLINKFAEDVIVFMESVPSGKEISLDHYLCGYPLEGRNIRIIGWDIDIESKFKMDEEEAQLFKEIVHLQREYLQTFDEEERRLICEEIRSRQEKIYSFSSEEGVSRMLKYAVESFSERTDSMINTLRRADEVVKNKFIIAGEGHFLKGPSFDFREESLEKFYQFLEERKAVILCPKEDRVREINGELKQV